MLCSKKIKCCFVGGFDILTPLTICGFNSLQILNQNYCLPFSNDRNGINLSDGGGLFLLELQENIFSQNALAYICGVGGANDVYHNTQPDPNGMGAQLSMTRALNCAGLKPKIYNILTLMGLEQ